MTAPPFAPDTTFGAVPDALGVRFTVWSGAAENVWLCLFDATGRETDRTPMTADAAGLRTTHVPGLAPGARYGFRADGPWEPARGACFDPRKLLVDPYALALDRRFAADPRLALPRDAAVDTAPLMPKAIVTALPEPTPPPPPVFRPGGLIYELNVRGFTIRHPEIPAELRGTVAALAQPAIIEHLHKIGVAAVELMPVTAWIDEPHLAPLGLANAWGYNPVAFLAPDPRLCPGGLPELAHTVAALRDAGIGVILDVVFNHTGEGDAAGPTLSLRGLDDAAYYRRRDADGALINDTGTGNTLACDRPPVMRLILDALRHLASTGVDGFRFDLAPVLGRTEDGFRPDAPLLKAMRNDPVIGSRILIAEPWDLGPGGYQLGGFPAPFLEWNDRYRDRVRRFWRCDPHGVGDLATALAGSGDVHPPPASRSVSFIAAHDGFSLLDLVSYRHKHNEPNGEANADGHGDNFSWNNGVEGPSDDPAVQAERRRDVQALLATLYATRGTIMLTAGDEFGRTQGGNNNAYAQDNATTWLDWAGRDRDIEAACTALARLRRAHPHLADPTLLTGTEITPGIPDVAWLTPGGTPKTVADWEHASASAFAMVLGTGGDGRLAVLFNRSSHEVHFHLPARPGRTWTDAPDGHRTLGPRAVAFVAERAV